MTDPIQPVPQSWHRREFPAFKSDRLAVNVARSWSNGQPEPELEVSVATTGPSGDTRTRRFYVPTEAVPDLILALGLAVTAPCPQHPGTPANAD